MKCKNQLVRTKQGRKYLYCKLLKKEITFDNCRDCANKEYKDHSTLKAKTNISEKKYKKHKLTKATEIPLKVKKEVWERDNHKCIYCSKEVPLSCANSHYIKRSQLGLGIPQNIVCACPICHDRYDFGINVQDMINYTREYLKSKYVVWNEEILKYKK